MVSYYDHATKTLAQPRILLDKHTFDAHDNPVISLDDQGYIWVFSTSHGTLRPSYVHRSSKPYSIEQFELIAPYTLDPLPNAKSNKKKKGEKKGKEKEKRKKATQRNMPLPTFLTCKYGTFRSKDSSISIPATKNGTARPASQ